MTWIRRLSIRWKITIGSVLVAAVLLTAASFIFRLQMEQVQINSDKKLLYDASTPYLTDIQSHPDQIDPPAGEQHVAVVSPDGAVVVSNLPDALSDGLGRLTELADGSHIVHEPRADYLVVVRTVPTADGAWHVVATRDLRLTAIVLANVTKVLIIGAVMLLAGFGLASWLLTTAALRPVSQMRRRAEELRASGSSEPLPVGPAQDELADLAITLNDFIASVRSTAAREKQMVSDASHELRTPIALLKIQLELAHLSEGNATALTDDLRLAENSVDRLSVLATNLLTLSSLDAGQIAQSSPWRELSAEFAAASDRARLLALDKSIAVEFDVEDASDDLEYPIAVAHFAQVVDNLISNALRAAPESGEVHARLVQHGTELRLSVEDTGPGMPDDFIGIAFDRFTRPDGQRGGALGGSGLGLAIVRAIVSSSRGGVRLANRPGGGFTATVTIPQSPSGQQPPSFLQAGSTAAEPTVPAEHGER
ncbi:HAMP domain-containing histidine kinase [Cryobacterium sp. TMT1-21]|uniref:sensor histidine kinase n=1 Tax=unclassified Cryobacterium TaxID=2649013 RepID=UPI00106DB39D|nr:MULTISPECIES: HAMP domain-containing sensor histidine kinase [unclassified Cryobacterium]TFC80888.1 HAMP domain-containing histidine kinase [Cryobacterium sp. TmT2-59]TFD13185.1 HAMP domain-containing histidine kinase [Cryobacterium sp. TMT1-21]TFD28407.1 HAMP domain-containing histidine kinase [Cryobacterium sp. TMT2-23]